LGHVITGVLLIVTVPTVMVTVPTAVRSPSLTV